MTELDALKTWHERLDHLGRRKIRRAIPFLNELKQKEVQEPGHCEPCKLAKSTNDNRTRESHKSKRSNFPPELAHVHIVRPVRHCSQNGS